MTRRTPVEPLAVTAVRASPSRASQSWRASRAKRRGRLRRPLCGLRPYGPLSSCARSAREASRPPSASAVRASPLRSAQFLCALRARSVAAAFGVRCAGFALTGFSVLVRASRAKRRGRLRRPLCGLRPHGLLSSCARFAREASRPPSASAVRASPSRASQFLCALRARSVAAAFGVRGGLRPTPAPAGRSRCGRRGPSRSRARRRSPPRARSFGT